MQEFPNINVQSLILRDSSITIDQIKELNFDSLDVTVCTNKTFDFYSCHKLDCELSNLFLQEQDVDLAQLKGEWYYVLFESCAFTNQIREDSFKTKCVEIKQADTIASDFLVPFEHLHCDELFVYVTKLGDSDIQLVNNSSTIKSVEAVGSWSKLTFVNCFLSGNSSVYKNVFQNTKMIVNVVQIQQTDLTALYNINTKLNLFIQSQIDLTDINKLSPFELNLENINVNLDHLKGWKTLKFTNCQFTNSQTKAINAHTVLISKSDFQISKCFNSVNMILKDTTINKLPDVSQLIVSNSNIRVNAVSNTIQMLTLTECEISRFSITLVPNLVSFQISDSRIQKTTSEYLNTKKKNRKKIESLNKIMNSLQNRNEKKIKHVLNLMQNIAVSIDAIESTLFLSKD
ncbi:Hypothetical_protein [Hexamita inflata]|uniref:Hypothetical_protein n=1 Tax=Hexamita inflata TaxID=28002 RepID=A0ABP1HR55_9EUKA